MKSIGGEGKRVDEEAADQLEKEESRVDGNHDLDTGALGPRHLEGEGRRAGQSAIGVGWSRRLSSVGARKLRGNG